MADARGRIRWTISLSLAVLFLAVHAASGQTRIAMEPARLTVTIGGTGAGRVEMTTPNKLEVASGKPIDLRPGSLVTLNPHAATGSKFVGWSGGACTGAAPCSFTMKDAVALRATFDVLPLRTLTVNRIGTGQGAVTAGQPYALNGSKASVPEGSVVTLTATAPTGQAFRGWSGDCAGTTLTCTVAMSADRNVNAQFEPAIQCGVDRDGDGHRAFGTATVFSLDMDCTDLGEASLGAPGNDCVDTDANVHPGATEVVGDSIDQDCDGRP